MTNRRRRPQVVQRPNHPFPGSDDPGDLIQRQEALIYPMNMDHVRLTKRRCPPDINPRIRDRDLKQIALAQPVTEINHQPLPNKIEEIQPSPRGSPIQRNHSRIVRRPITHQHQGRYALPKQCPQKTIGSDSGATRMLSGIEN